MSQFKSMMKKHRWIASTIYVLMILVTFVVAFKSKSVAAVLVCVLLQFLSALWYCLSYIPYARAFVKKMFGC